MKMKYAEYIQRIEIDALWGNRKHIVWELDPEVNILSGVNGDGKSTILRRAKSGVRKKDADEKKGIHVTTVPEDAEYVRYDWIGTPDVRSEYDENLFALIEKFNSLPSKDGRRGLLYDTIDRLFAASHKTVDRKAKDFRLLFYGEPIDLKVLSSGEKQMLTILLAVYLENGEHCVLFMDEPEMSLHIEWQKVLISTVRQLNPNAQIILSTHSPAVIMDGWMDKVTEVGEITVD